MTKLRKNAKGGKIGKNRYNSKSTKATKKAMVPLKRWRQYEYFGIKMSKIGNRTKKLRC